MQPISTYLVPRADVRDIEISAFMTHLIVRFPYEFAPLISYDHEKHECQLQKDLGLEPGVCGLIYHTMARQYGLQTAALTLKRTQVRDIRICELYHRLCHETRMLDVNYVPQISTETKPICPVNLRRIGIGTFIKDLIEWSPDSFGLLIGFGGVKHECRMQTHLEMLPDDRAAIYRALAKRYGLQPSELTMRWMQIHDVSISQLYHQLCQETRMLDRAMRRVKDSHLQ